MARICNPNRSDMQALKRFPCETNSKSYRLIYKSQAEMFVVLNKENYIHQNLVEEVLVYKTEDYIYSSIINYLVEKCLLEKRTVFRELIIVFPYNAIVR